MLTRNWSARLALPLSLPALLLTGCGIVSTTSSVASDSSTAVAGKVFGGQQPVKFATITVWAMNSDGSTTSLGTTATDTNGAFAFAANAYACPFTNTPVYITAAGGDAGSGTNANLVMAAGLGTCASGKTATVNINEVSTVITALALGHYFNGTFGGTPTNDLFGAAGTGGSVYNVGLVAANSTGIASLLDLRNGLVIPSTTNRVVESAKIYSMANSLAACVNSAGQTSTTETTTNCGQLFNFARNPTRASDTLQAAVQLALFPYKNVTQVYNLASSTAPFVGLSSAPNDWTVGVSYTTTAMALGINGSASTTTSAAIDIDAAGRIWFPSSKTGATGVGYFDPASQTFNGPYGSALTHPQYVAIDNGGKVWSTDLNSGTVVGVNSTTPATVTTFSIPAATMGPLAVDSSDLVDLTYTSGGNFSLATINTGRTAVNTYGAAFVQNPTGFAAGFGLYASTSGTATKCSLEENSIDSGTNTLNGNFIEVSTVPNCNSGQAAIDINETATMTASTANQFCNFRETTCRTPAVGLNLPQSIAVDGDDNLWIANQGNASVSTLHGYGDGSTTKYITTSSVPYLHGTGNGATLTTPFGIAVDGSGNVWVFNPGCVTTNAAIPCTPGSTILTELFGAAAPTITPLAAQASSQRWGNRPLN